MKVLGNGKAVEKVDPPAVGGAEAMREAAAKAVEREYVDRPFRGYARERSSYIARTIRALPLPEPTPDPRDATITRLSAELEAARECLKRLASLVPFPTPDELGFIHPQVAARAEFARAALAKLSKGK